MTSLPDIETPDLDVVATQLAKVKRSASFSDVLTGISAQDTMQGSSTLTLHLEDQDFQLLDTGFFDADENGHLDAVDINYPHDSKYWWRLTQVTPNAAGNLDLTFMERPACLMLDLFGPLKVSRAKMTRAEFIDFLARHVKKYGGIQFHSRELHQKQKLDKPKKGDRRANKHNGAHKKDDITIKGVAPTQEQIDNVNTAMDVADQVKAPKLACIAMLCAGIGESSFVAQPNAGGSNYWGVFQGAKNVWKMDDTAGMAKSFLKGGKGFQGGGAIALAKKHPNMDPGGIATLVEASGQPGHFYGTYKSEAEKLFKAYGGLSGSGGSRYKQYNFEVGSQENPHETYWDAANRLAQEVNWALFLDGNDLFYDSEMELIKQLPVAVIHRDDPEVVDWDYTWDVRHVATEMTITLICEPFEFRAGEVFLLQGFGAASVGSTAKLPGRWLISESDRDRASFSTTFTLKQPTKPNPEPRPDTVDQSGSAGTSDIFSAAKTISGQHRTYSQASTRVIKETKKQTHLPLDCSNSVCLALSMAGMYDKPVADVSGVLAKTWGKKGRGSEWTLWANGDHVFIMSEKGRAWRFDTSPHNDGPPGPRVRYSHRETAGFTPRHWTG